MIVFVSLLIALNSAPAQGWMPTTAPGANWVSIASSADGSKLAALILDGVAVYTSTNSGTNRM
jgi:hypothetical protein